MKPVLLLLLSLMTLNANSFGNSSTSPTDPAKKLLTSYL